MDAKAPSKLFYILFMFLGVLRQASFRSEIYNTHSKYVIGEKTGASTKFILCYFG